MKKMLTYLAKCFTGAGSSGKAKGKAGAQINTQIKVESGVIKQLYNEFKFGNQGIRQTAKAWLLSSPSQRTPPFGGVTV